MRLVLLLMIGLDLFAGIWTRLGGFGTKEIKPDSTYTIDTIGENPRVYEFTPRANPNYTCIIVYTESNYKSPVMQCIPKAKNIKK